MPSFKSILIREFKDSSIFTLAIYLPVIINFVLIPFYWQKLTPRDFGIIAIVEIVTIYIGIFSGLKLETSLNRFYYEWNENQRKENITTLWFVQWGSNIIIGILAITIVFYLHSFIFPDIAFIFFFLGITSYTLESLFVFPTNLVRIQKRPTFFTIISLIKSLLLISLNIYFILILERGVIGYYNANIIGHGVIAILGTGIMVTEFSYRFNYPELKKSLRFSLPLIPNLMIASITKTFDKLLLQKFVSTEALGLFSQAVKISSLINKLYQAIKSSYVPFLYKTIFEEKKKDIVYKINKFYLIPLFVASFVLSTFVDEFITWVNQPAYLEIIKFLPYLILVELISSMVIFYTPGISLAKRNELLVIPTTINSLITILGSFLLIPYLQIYGLIVIRLFLAVVSLVIRAIISLKVYELKYDWLSLFYYLFIYIGLSVAGLLIVSKSMIINILFGFILVCSQLVFMVIYLMFKRQKSS